MFCRKCGAQLKENAKFCARCGTPVTTENVGASAPAITGSIIEKDFDVPIAKEDTQKKKSNKNGFIIILIVLLLLLLAGAAAGAYFFLFSTDARYNRAVEKAEQCVDEGEYEQAIGYYLNAISLKENEEDAYIALAEAYEYDDDMDKAIRTLEKGLEKTESRDIEKKLEKLRGEDSGDSEQETAVVEATTEAATEATAEATSQDKEPYTGVKKNVNIGVRQVDASNFPEITLYASITDESGNVVEGMDMSDFTIQEIVDGTTVDASINDVHRVISKDHINVNLVMDASGSMSDYSKMTQAKNAAKALVNQMKLADGDQVEVISFDDYVYLEQEFTNYQSGLITAIDNITLGGSTALYDGLYAGLYQTHYETGAKCVIGFTDGMENASSYTYQDVVTMSKNTSIPVFIIGIGEEYDADELQRLANECSGRYYSANANDLESVLEDIYLSIYQEQQDYYVVKYKTQNTQNIREFRDVVLKTSETSEFTGYYKKEYVPEADITGAFSGSYMDKDFMIPDSDQRSVTEADLAGMSLAELRIARNEIFARHGRQFSDSMLNQWFYSKVWYLNIGAKYSPSTFDSTNPNPLSKLELENANFILNYEKNIMNTQDIYPNAATTRLSDYDLALSKPVLKTALSQMQSYQSTTILEENKRLVQEAINKEDVQY